MALAPHLRAVTLIPGASEAAYDPRPVLKRDSAAVTAENRHAHPFLSDFEVSLDQLAVVAPGVRNVSLVVAWHGSDLRCGHCTIRPKVEVAAKDTDPAPWRVSGLERADAPVVSTVDGGPALGGAPSDASVVRAIRRLKARGYGVTLYPFVLMDIPAGNGLPNPGGGIGQPVYPWRGRITCHPAPGQPGTVDLTPAAADQVAAFFGTAPAVAFTWEPGLGTVAYGGPAEWSFRRLVLHYAHLCRAAGGVDAFLIGSELVGLTTVRSAPGVYPAVTQLQALAADVRSVLGPRARLGYAADWTEYHSHRPADGTNGVWFHLDPLWADAAIDFVGIDAYFPLADWRDGAHHRDTLDGAASPYDLDYLRANIEGGDAYDWYYASGADRDAQVRSPIADWWGEDWIFRAKDVRGWWSAPHRNRPAGDPAGAPTAWVPQGKPIWFTEVGCPAVDKGANQPNVFVDPKSSESTLPHFSSGARDDAAQAAYLEAIHTYWQPEAGHNPISAVYGGSMLDTERLFVWTWDARPFPAFPQRADVWSDGVNWARGHWLTGRLGPAPVTAGAGGDPSPGAAWRTRTRQADLPLALDFASRRFTRDGRRVTLGDVLAFTRAGAGAVVDLDGTPAEVGADVARLGRGVGLVLDPGRENAIPNPALVGAAVGVVGSGGALPVGWHVSAEITSLEVLAIGEMAGGDARWPTITLRLVCDNTAGLTQLSPRLRFAPENGIPAAPGEAWAGSVFAQVLASTALKVRLSLLPRDGSGSAIVSTYATLPSLFGRVGVSAVLPAGTVEVETALQLTVPAGTLATVDVVLALPMLEAGAGASSPIRRSPGEMITGVRAAEDAALVAPVLPGAHGVLAIEAEERAVIGDGVLASFAWGEDWCLLVHGGADPGVTLAYRGVTVREDRRLPVIPSAIVRFAVGWRRGRLLVAFNAALDRLAIDVADVRFRPTAAPALRLGADAEGGREALTAVRLVAGGPWQPTPEMVRGLAADPGLPSVPSPWRLYRHAFAAPALADAPAVPFWSPIPYDTSDDTIGWNGPPPDPMPDEQIVPPDMIVPSMYGPRDPENPGRDIVHAPSYAAFLSIVTPIREFQKAFVQATDGYLAAGSPLVAFGMAGGMLQAAEAGVLTGVRNDTGTAQIERWLGCTGSAWLKISRAGFGTPEERAAIEAHFRQMADELIAFQLLKRATGSSYAINNHYFWASWGIAVVGLILGDRAMIAWGHDCLDFAIDASAEAGAIVVELEPGEDDGEGFPGGDDDPDPESEEVEGTQPAESVRLTRALHYHNFAMPPLVALAEIAIADGRDPYARRNGQLHKMAKFVSDAIDNPALMTAVQEAILGEGLGAEQDTSMWTGPEGLVGHALPNGSQMAWMWVYCRRFPDSEVARKWAPRLVEVYTSLRSSNLGGDMRLLYPWRHPTPARLTISFGPYVQVKAYGLAVSGTAAPGARVTISGAGPDRIATADGAGAWSIDMTDLAIGEWDLTAHQETQLGVHPRVGFGISVIAHQAETTAVLSRWNDLGTPASRARSDALDAWIINIKSSGLWTKLDALYFPQHSVEATRVNLINPSGPLLTLNNSPTIVPDQYLQGDGTSAYFDTGINPATEGGAFALNDATLFVWSLTDLNAANSADIGSGTTTRLIGRAAGNIGARANASATTSVAVADSLGLYGWRRTGSTGHSFFRGGGVVSSPTSTSTSISSSPVRIGGAGTLYSSRRIAAAGFGGGLIDGDLYNLWYFLRDWLIYLGAITE